MMQLLLSPNLF